MCRSTSPLKRESDFGLSVRVDDNSKYREHANPLPSSKGSKLVERADDAQTSNLTSNSILVIFQLVSKQPSSSYIRLADNV